MVTSPGIDTSTMFYNIFDKSPSTLDVVFSLDDTFQVNAVDEDLKTNSEEEEVEKEEDKKKVTKVEESKRDGKKNKPAINLKEQDKKALGQLNGKHLIHTKSLRMIGNKRNLERFRKLVAVKGLK